MKLTGEGSRLDSLLTRARSEAIAAKRHLLVSWSEPASDVEPLAWLQHLMRASGSDPELASLASEGSMYWTHPAEHFAFSGLGAVATLTPAADERFRSADEAWTELLSGAVIGAAVDDASYDGAPQGVGPILAGGFAFDTEGARGPAWRGFASDHLFVPRLRLTSVDGKCWVTLSALVKSDGEPDIPAEVLSLLRTVAVSASVSPSFDSSGELPAGGISYTDHRPAAEWQAVVAEAVAAIHSGALDKVVLARAVVATAERHLDVFALLRHLEAAHRDAFVFGYWRGTRVFVGASPERLVRVDGRRVQASSLAGTAKRGATTAEDSIIAADLLASAKDRSEHALVRDALKEVMTEVCDEVSAPEIPSVLSLPHVHHLHTEIRGLLRPRHSLLDLVARLHPTPAVGGSPRDAALEFIREREQLDRGWYAGPIGWIGLNGGEFAVALRSAIVAGSEAVLFAGCGIVADSDPELELAESLLKLKPMQTALAAARSDSSVAAAAAAGQT